MCGYADLGVASILRRSSLPFISGVTANRRPSHLARHYRYSTEDEFTEIIVETS